MRTGSLKSDQKKSVSPESLEIAMNQERYTIVHITNVLEKTNQTHHMVNSWIPNLVPRACVSPGQYPETRDSGVTAFLSPLIGFTETMKKPEMDRKKCTYWTNSCCHSDAIP